MSDDRPTSGGSTDIDDPAKIWWEVHGNRLKNALLWIEHWRHEARGTVPREITYQELTFRCMGDLHFDGEAYVLADGLAEVIAKMGTPGLKRVTIGTETEKDLGIPPRLHYDLACHIARTNKEAGWHLGKALLPFASKLAESLKRARGRSLEDNQLFRTLAWWGVDRGVKLGLYQGKTRSDPARNSRKKSISATELVVECFARAGWKHVTYNMVNDAWQAHRHEGEDNRKLVVRSHVKVYDMRFKEIDRLLDELSDYEEV